MVTQKPIFFFNFPNPFRITIYFNSLKNFFQFLQVRIARQMRENEDLEPLDRRLKTIPSQIWLSTAQRQTRVFFGGGNATIKNLAVLLPTSTALRYKRNCEDEKYLQRMSVQYLNRVSYGERRMNDVGLAKRAETNFLVDSRILNSSLCELLIKPDMRRRDFNKIFTKIKEKLEGRVFKKIENGEKIAQKRCYWSHENLFLINSQDFLTYQLLLINKNSDKALPSNFSISKLILLFWRVLITTSLGEHAETLCEAIFRYLKINLPEKSIASPPDGSNYFEALRKIAFSSISTYPSYTDSFDSYRTYTKAMCEKAANNFFGTTEWLTQTSFYTEIIYWSDRYVHKWINGDVDKAALFDPNTKEYSEIIKGIHFSSKHRIW